MTGSANEYDLIPYPSFPFPQSHPDRMFTVARWRGMDPAPSHPARSRILELGCARGENLIALALELPEAELIGIDLSVSQIAIAEEACQELGVSNVRFLQGDLQDAGDDLGEFDYIIAHGVYSWVPPAVQQRLLEICKRQLKSNGIAYVSYNAYPGWRQASVVRDLLLFHTREISDPRVQLKEAHDILQFFARNVPHKNREYRDLYQKLLQDVEEDSRLQTSLFHDYLAPHNMPVHFLQFAQHAQQCGLQYLGEATIPDVEQPHLLPEVTNAFSDLDPLVREQYCDFLNNTKFRQTLLCRRDARISGERRNERLKGMHLACDISAEKLTRDRQESDPIQLRVDFQGQPLRMTIEHPLSRAALTHLVESNPRTVSFEDLQVAARARISPTEIAGIPRDQLDRELEQFTSDLEQLISLGLVRLHSYQRPVSAIAGETPCAAPWVRWCAARGNVITNLFHQTTPVTDSLRDLLSRLDGTVTRDELLAERRQNAAAQNIVFFRDGAELSEDWEIDQLLREVLERELQFVARNALLIS